MKRAIAILLVVAALLCGGCGFVTGEAVETPAPAPVMKPPASPVMPEPSRLLEISHVGVMPGSEISFGGPSRLPEGTVLESQLYDDEGAVDWWPDTRAEVWRPRGSWDITVSLEGLSDAETGLYIGSPTRFRIEVWDRDDPAIRAGYSLDLMGPPPAR